MRRSLLPLLSTLTLLALGGLMAAVKAPKPDRGRDIVPQPNAPLPRAEIEAIMGKAVATEVSREIRILWLAGPEDHKGGEHDYLRIKELFVPMLERLPKVTVDEAFGFPTQAQFDQADVMIQYLHLPDLTDDEFAMYQAYVDGGGAVLSIHESCIMRPVERAEKLADCIGCSWAGNDVSQWSKFSPEHPLHLDNDHSIFSGLPSSLRFNDESYWALLKREEVEVIAAVAPEAITGSFDEILGSEGSRGDAFWTYHSGEGRVVGTTTGHYTYTFHDPLYRLLLVRCLAWALEEDPAAFHSLVFDGITDEAGLVGTTDTMLDYENRTSP